MVHNFNFDDLHGPIFYLKIEAKLSKTLKAWMAIPKRSGFESGSPAKALMSVPSAAVIEKLEMCQTW
jgi:hypothetical protein